MSIPNNAILELGKRGLDLMAGGTDTWLPGIDANAADRWWFDVKVAAGIEDPRADGDQVDSLGYVVADIAAERRRQLSEEGWSPEHDDRQEGGQLGNAAACYAMHPACRAPCSNQVPPTQWPWVRAAWKPTPSDRRRELVKAGALIVAEIERMDRASARGVGA